MKRCSLAFALLALAASLQAFAAEPAPRASVGTKGLTLKPIAKGPNSGKQRAEQAFDFTFGERPYQVRYAVVADPAQPDKAFPSEGYVGMTRPCSCNWYHSGFIFVKVNGQDIGTTKLHKGYVAETGSRAIADIVWDAAPARVRLRFAGRPGDDKLLCEVALEPKEEIKDLQIMLRCYPSFFTSWHKRKGDRKILTPAATINQGENVSHPAAEHWYAVYYDTIFDVAKGEGEGPCAMMFSPDAVKTVKFDVGGYAVTTHLICDLAARSVRLAFWEFPKVNNDEVLAAFRSQANKCAAQLRDFDFTPAAVRSFDPKSELAELTRLSQAPEVRKQLGAKAEQYRKQIEALTPASGPPGILQQAELLALIADYREFLWELKLAALIAD